MSDGARKSPRLTRDFELVWAIESKSLSGRGKLVDVSIGGACLMLNQEQRLDKGTVMALVCSRLSALPSNGIVMWTRKSGTGTLCGIEFSQSNQRWTSWVGEQIALRAAAAKA